MLWAGLLAGLISRRERDSTAPFAGRLSVSPYGSRIFPETTQAAKESAKWKQTTKPESCSKKKTKRQRKGAQSVRGNNVHSESQAQPDHVASSSAQVMST